MNKFKVLKKSMLCLLVILVSGCSLFSGSSSSEVTSTLTFQYENTFGTIDQEIINRAVDTPDGNIIMAGYNYTFTNQADAYIVKMDQNGNKIWSRIYGHANSDSVMSIIQMNNNTIACAGLSYSFQLSNCATWLFTLNSSGTILWETNYYFSNTNEAAYSIIETSDNCLLLAGIVKNSSNLYDSYVMKVSNNGSIMWRVYIGTNNYNITPYKLLEDNNSYIVVGRGYCDYLSLGINVSFIAKLNANGSLIYFKTYDSPDIIYDIIKSDSGYYVGVGSENNDSYYCDDISIASYDDNGNRLSSYTYWWPCGNDCAYSISQYSNNTFLLAGNVDMRSNTLQNNELNGFIGLFTTNNKIWWTNTGGSGRDVFKYAFKTTDGGVISVGYTASKIDTNGDAWMVKWTLQ